MRAVIYTRSARPSRAAHEEQWEACERLAAEFGYEVGGVFRDEGRTRPGLDQLLATIRDRKASALVVSVLSRLGRTLGAFTRVIETLNEAGAPLFVVGQGRVTIPMAPVLGIMLAVAQFDHEQLRGKRA